MYDNEDYFYMLIGMLYKELNLAPQKESFLATNEQKLKFLSKLYELANNVKAKLKIN